MCIVCCDGLKGLPDAIGATWPLATVQTCVVHLVRNSLRYASKAHWSKITAGLRTVYTAPTVAAAETRFAEFAGTWRETYPAMVGMWERSWAEFVPVLDFPVEIRKLIYTTNGIESLNARFRQAVRRRGHFPTEQAPPRIRLTPSLLSGPATAEGCRPRASCAALASSGRSAFSSTGWPSSRRTTLAVLSISSLAVPTASAGSSLTARRTGPSAHGSPRGR